MIFFILVIPHINPIQTDSPTAVLDAIAGSDRAAKVQRRLCQRQTDCSRLWRSPRFQARYPMHSPGQREDCPDFNGLAFEQMRKTHLPARQD